MSANVETMFSVRLTPWHGLGTIVQEALTSDEALKIAELDWRVEQHPIFVDNKQVDNYVANVRLSDQSVLGIVTERYQIVQNREAFSFTDGLLDYNVKYETAGSLAGGRRVWMLAKMPETYILEDKVVPYLVFTNSHDGKGSIKVAVTPIRVVCQNTLNLALSSAYRSWSTKHIGDMDAKMEEAKRTLIMSKLYMSELKATAEKLAKRDIYQKQFIEFVEELYPITNDMGDRKSDNILILRQDLTMRYLQAPDLKAYMNTAWGIIEAVSDHATHMLPLKRSKTYYENNFIKTVDGNPVIDRAFELLAS